MIPYYRGVKVRMTCGHFGVIATDYLRMPYVKMHALYRAYKRGLKLQCSECGEARHAQDLIGTVRL